MFWTQKGKESGIFLRPLSFPPLHSAAKQCNFAVRECLYYFKKLKKTNKGKVENEM